MQEFIELQRKCLEALNTVLDCGQNCSNSDFCTMQNLNKGDCSHCLNNIHYGTPPSCSYNCERITYRYTLRFFNKYASEIYHFLNLHSFENISVFNVVSLGCGPGSEVYGIIKTLQSKNPHVTLHYAGFDNNPIWKNVQDMSKQCLGQTQHDIQFHTEDLFTSERFSDNNTIHLLILNYLLSDVVKFRAVDERKSLVNGIKEFIIKNNVCTILFNDICFYGNNNCYNSGVQLMKYLIQLLENDGMKLKTIYMCFENDPYLGNEKWNQHKRNTIISHYIPENKYTENIRYCNSKQLFVHIHQ